MLTGAAKLAPWTRPPTLAALRQSQTLAEEKLWAIVRGRRLDGFKFRRQVPIDRYFARLRLSRRQAGRRTRRRVA